MRSRLTSRRCGAAGTRSRKPGSPRPPRSGTFVAPTLIEIGRIADVEREVFGPVLHVLRYTREALDALIDDINAAGYGLTFGLHTRIDETIARVVERDRSRQYLCQSQHHRRDRRRAAVRRLEPFRHGPEGGRPALSLAPSRRAAAGAPSRGSRAPARRSATLRAYIDWLRAAGHAAEAERCVGLASRSPFGARIELSGPVGERNVYRLRRRGRIAAVAASASGLLIQIGAILATGNDALVSASWTRILKRLPAEFARRVSAVDDPLAAPALAGALIEGEGEAVINAARKLATRPGPIVRLQALSPARLAAGDDYNLADLVEECSIATNTAAAGGNASLMTIG